MGEVCVAFVVPRPGTTVDVEAVLVHARTSLAEYKSP
jgi:hypothetical protein